MPDIRAHPSEPFPARPTATSGAARHDGSVAP